MSQPLTNRQESGQEIYPEELLRRYRTRAGLSQDELAVLVGLTGGRMIQSWEGGFSLPKASRLRTLLEIFVAKKAFTTGKELEEARRLWGSVQKFFESNSEKLSAYPHFDANWFSNQVLQTGVVAEPAPAPAVILPAAAVPDPETALPLKTRLPLPPSPDSIIGRDTELEEVSALLLEGKVRLVTLTGPGGSGKTRLALETASRLNQPSSFRDGIYFVALETINSTELLAPQLAATLDIVQSDTASPLELVKGFLSNRQVLLVLDNFEQLLPATPLVADLLKTAPGLQILMTSREPLRLKDEREYRVAPLSLPVLTPGKLDLNELAANPAVAFFNRRSALANSDYAFNLSNVEAVAKVCQRLDGLPLAIELAAGRTNLLSPAQILTRLDNRFKLLASSSPAYSSRHRTLHGALEWSYDLLDPTEQRLLARLGIFAGAFCVEAAESVCTDDSLEVLDGLDSLINKNLLQRVKNSDGPVRCQLLQTIRDFALGKLDGFGPAEKEGIRLRLETYYLELVESSELHFRDSQQASVFETLEQEYPNIREAINNSLAKDNPIAALRICGALWYFWWTHGYIPEGRANLEKVLTFPIDNKAARAKALNALGNLAEIQGDLNVSLTYFGEGLELFRELGDYRGMGNTSNNLGNVLSVKGDLPAARNYLEQSLEYRKRTGDRHAIAASLTNLGRLARLIGDYATCLNYYEEALEIFRQVNDKGSLAQILSNLANLTLNTGDLEAARKYARESLELAEQTHNKAMQIHSFISLGQVYFEVKQWEESGQYYQKALELSQQVDDQISIGGSLEGLGRVFIEMGRFEDAGRCLDKALSLVEKLGARQAIVTGLLAQAWLAFKQKNFKLSRELLARSTGLQVEGAVTLEQLDRLFRQRLEDALVAH